MDQYTVQGGMEILHVMLQKLRLSGGSFELLDP